MGGSVTAAAAFETDPADVEAYADELHHSGSWPFVVLRLAYGHRLYVLFRNFEGDAGWDYLLQPEGTDTVMTLAALEGHFRGPAFSWRDLVVVASQPDLTRSGAERLLLLLPAMGDANLPDEAEQLIAASLVAVGVRQPYQREVARELLTASHRFWGARGPVTQPDLGASIAEAFGSGM